MFIYEGCMVGQKWHCLITFFVSSVILGLRQVFVIELLYNQHVKGFFFLTIHFKFIDKYFFVRIKSYYYMNITSSFILEVIFKKSPTFDKKNNHLYVSKLIKSLLFMIRGLQTAYAMQIVFIHILISGNIRRYCASSKNTPIQPGTDFEFTV